MVPGARGRSCLSERIQPSAHNTLTSERLTVPTSAMIASNTSCVLGGHGDDPAVGADEVGDGVAFAADGFHQPVGHLSALESREPLRITLRSIRPSMTAMVTAPSRISCAGR
jgi:hypothetical protein